MDSAVQRFGPRLERGTTAYQQLHRYGLASDLATGKRVLDLACGYGDGTNLLAEAAAEAVGVDIDPANIRHAKARFKRPNLTYVAADCFDLPFEAGSFDLVVVGEMSKHARDRNALIGEAKRVLRPAGILLISTADAAPGLGTATAQGDVSQFGEILKRHFKHVQLTGLRLALVSLGYRIEQSSNASNLAAAKIYQGRYSETGALRVKNEELELAGATSVLGYCSDEPLEVLPSPSTLFFSPDDDLWLDDLSSAQPPQRVGEDDASAASSQGDGAVHLSTTSKLLSRLVGAPVDADPASLVEAFAVNEQLVTQRLQLEAAAEFSTRARDAELKSSTEREDLVREINQVKAATARAEGELAVTRTELREARSEAIRKEEELVQARRQHEEQAKAAARLDSTLADLTERLSDLNQDRERLSAEHEKTTSALRTAQEQVEQGQRRIDQLVAETARLAEQRDALVDAKEELERASVEAANAPAASPGTNGGQPPVSLKRSSDGVSAALERRKGQFATGRRWVRQQLEQATIAVRNATESLPPAPPVKMRKRFLRPDLPIVDTVVFDPGWVEGRYGLKQVSLGEFLRKPDCFRMDPHPLFAAQGYLDANRDVAAAGIAPLLHYLTQGWREGRDPHPYFANDWYLHRYPDVLKSASNPLDHYLRFGWREGRWPNPAFDPIAYLDRHPDVRESGMEPLTHYVMFGLDEERAIPFRGLGSDWRSFVVSDARSVLDVLLHDDGSITELAEKDGPERDAHPFAEPQDTGGWPPRPLDDYSLPQGLRDLLVDTHRGEWIPLYQYLCSVMESFADREEEFPDSGACAGLIRRLSTLASRSDADGGSPDATIIIPVYNNLLDTLLSLASILETQTELSFEVIVADDGSTDRTPRLIPQIGGVVRHVRQPENYGFLGNCNAAAEKAAGRLIVLLNNDTLVLPGWLEALIGPFERHDRIGLVGSKLINWDGSLQEAGGIFWQDGSAWNFGRGRNALECEFNYLKDVDYCSGASIAVPSSVWNELKGFDPMFAPAYCEDSDLAFRIRAAGYRTLYNPQSEVIHHEGRSHGRDLSLGIKAYQVVNQERLFGRWAEVLSQDHYPNAQNVLRARDRSGRKKHVLVIDHYVPQWDRDAGSRTIFQYIEIFLELGFQVTFWPDNLYADPVYTPVLQGMGIEVVYGSRYREGFEDFIRERRDLYDAVFLSRPHVAQQYVHAIRQHTSARLLYYGHDLHFRRMEASRALGAPVEVEEIAATREMEFEVCRACDVIFYPDPAEVKQIQHEVGGDRLFLPNPVFVYDDAQIAAARERVATVEGSRSCRLLFVGGFKHSPNREGITWFINEVMPVLEQRLPDVRLDVAGSNPPPEVCKLASDTVSVLGLVSDDHLARLYANAGLVVAPLLHGAGVKGKIIEAMAFGVPVATTAVGAQGIDVASDVLFLGDTPDDLAEAIIAGLTDRAEAAGKAERAVQFIERHYTRRTLKDLFQRLIP
jgi:GT2 family glycosyltransferase/SAM-dependent methyltransferase